MEIRQTERRRTPPDILEPGLLQHRESLTANNIVLSVYNHVTNPECRQYLLRQAYEEAIHTDTFIYCCDSLGLDPDSIYGMYETIPSIREKDAFVIDLTQGILDPHFTTEGPANIRRFIHDLIGYYVIMEGIFFYAGFAMMLALKRQRKMVGIGEQFEYIMRDESLHLAFGVDLINTIVHENPGVWDQAFRSEITALVTQAVDLEKIYARDRLSRGHYGIHRRHVQEYVEHIADRRLERIGLDPIFNRENPFPWMSQSMDLAKEKNFFETRVTEYQTAGSLEWD